VEGTSITIKVTGLKRVILNCRVSILYVGRKEGIKDKVINS